MGKICRFKPERIAELAFNEAIGPTMQAAQNAGLPVDSEQGQQICAQLVMTAIQSAITNLQTKYGIFVAIGDDSPYFAQFIGAAGAAQQNVSAPRQVVPPQAALRPLRVVPPAQYVPPQPPQQFPPQQQPMQPQHSHIPPPPPGAIFPGQPLPPVPARPAAAPLPPGLFPPGGANGGGVSQLPSAPVNPNAPVFGNGDSPPSMTNPAPEPSILG